MIDLHFFEFDVRGLLSVLQLAHREREGDAVDRFEVGEFSGDLCESIVTAEPAGRVITAALVVVPGPGDTVTFVWQERGPYAGWWLLPGGKVEFYCGLPLLLSENVQVPSEYLFLTRQFL